MDQERKARFDKETKGMFAFMDDPTSPLNALGDSGDTLDGDFSDPHFQTGRRTFSSEFDLSTLRANIFARPEFRATRSALNPHKETTEIQDSAFTKSAARCTNATHPVDADEILAFVQDRRPGMMSDEAESQSANEQTAEKTPEQLIEAASVAARDDSEQTLSAEDLGALKTELGWESLPEDIEFTSDANAQSSMTLDTFVKTYEMLAQYSTKVDAAETGRADIVTAWAQQRKLASEKGITSVKLPPRES